MTELNIDNINLLDKLSSFLGHGDINSDLWIICTEESGKYTSKNEIDNRIKQYEGFKEINVGEKQYFISDFIEDNGGSDCGTYRRLRYLLSKINVNYDLGKIGNFYINMFPVADAIKRLDVWTDYAPWLEISRREYLKYCKEVRVNEIRNIINFYNPQIVLMLNKYSYIYTKDHTQLQKSNSNSYSTIFLPNIITGYHPMQRRISVDDWSLDITTNMKRIINH